MIAMKKEDNASYGQVFWSDIYVISQTALDSPIGTKQLQPS